MVSNTPSISPSCKTDKIPAVKCPPDPKLLQLLADMDVSFYCASLAKIEQLENPSWAGVAPADLCVRSYRHIARRTQKDTTTKRPDMLYLNDGLYGRFSMKWSEDKIFVSTLIELRGTSTLAPREWKPHRYSIWVPTCDSNDCISKEVVMDQEMMIGD